MGMESRVVSDEGERFVLRKLTLPDIAAVARSKRRTYTAIPIDPVLAHKRRGAAQKRREAEEALLIENEAARHAEERARRIAELRTQAARLQDEIELLQRQSAE